MNAVTLVERLTRTHLRRIVFCAVFLLPIVGYLVSRIKRGRWWFHDWDALVCAAHSASRGQSPYGPPLPCGALHPTPFVYAPLVGRAFAPVANAILGTSHLVCLVLIVPSIAFLLWYAVRKPVPDAPWQLRVMSLAAMGGSVFACGNVGLMLHALIVAAALILKRSRLPFIVAVLFAAAVKPVFLTCLIVLLYENRPARDRLITGTIAGAAGLLVVAAVALTPDPLSDAWHAAMNSVIMTEQPGIGFFAFAHFLGLSPLQPLSLCLLAVFTTAIMLAGLALAEGRRLCDSQRLVLGLGVAQLLNPRMMDYDMMLLAPTIAVVVMQAQPLGRRLYTIAGGVFVATLTGAVVINVFEIEHIHRAPVSIFIYCLVLLAVGGAAAWRHRARWLSLLTLHRPQHVGGGQ